MFIFFVRAVNYN